MAPPSLPISPEINTDDDILAYLSSIYPDHNFSSATRLTGGSANLVWRITVEAPDQKSPFSTALGPGGKHIIIKHAKPYVIDNPSIPFPTVRMDFEAHVLSLLPSILSPPDSNALKGSESETSKPEIKLPTVFAYDSAANILSISDGGSRTLKDAYASLSTAQVQAVGTQLAKWLARLHTSTKSVDIGQGGNQTARTIYRYAYANVGGVWQKLGLGKPDMGKIVNDKYGALLATDDDCVCHGDFWPGNMLIGDAVQDGNETPADVTVVDLEMTRRGVAATDVAQFVAEAYLLDHFRATNHQLVRAFLCSYVEQTHPDKRFWERFAVHLGVHLSFWPSRVEWAGEAETRAVAEFGAKIAIMALEEDVALEEFLMSNLTASSVTQG